MNVAPVSIVNRIGTPLIWPSATKCPRSSMVAIADTAVVGCIRAWPSPRRHPLSLDIERRAVGLD
jgi:hypothetical protein